MLIANFVHTVASGWVEPVEQQQNVLGRVERCEWPLVLGPIELRTLTEAGPYECEQMRRFPAVQECSNGKSGIERLEPEFFQRVWMIYRSAVVTTDGKGDFFQRKRRRAFFRLLNTQ